MTVEAGSIVPGQKEGTGVVYLQGSGRKGRRKGKGMLEVLGLGGLDGE